MQVRGLAQSLQANPGASTEANSARSGTIMLVEDEPATGAILGRALLRAGYRVIEASNGAEALWLSDRHQADIDLLVTDIVMPVMAGPELATELTRRRPGLKVLYISAYLAGINDGGKSAFLSKPFMPSELLKAVRRALASRSSAN